MIDFSIFSKNIGKEEVAMQGFVLCFLLLTSLAFAQRQSIVVLPTIADTEVKLSPRELELLTEKVRSIIPEILPLKDFNLLKQDAVLERLGAEGLFAACKEGSCVGDLVARVQADFGARCEVISANKQLYLKFELYGTLRGEKDAGTISQFNDPVKDFNAMLALLDKKAPEAFKKIVSESPPAPTQTPVPVAPALSGNYVAQIVTEPAGAALEMNGTPYEGCPKTPCAISLYENRIKLSVTLSEHETKDTTVTITVPNQIVTIKLKPKVYNVKFISEPSGAALTLASDQNVYECKTPCDFNLKKGTVKVSANLDKFYDPILGKEVSVAYSGQQVKLELNPNFGTLDIKGADGWDFDIKGAELYLTNRSLDYIKLLPGTYDVRLFNKCYEDIKTEVKIERNDKLSFDISDKMALKQGTLVLRAKRKGRNVSRPVFVDGKQAGETPFEGSVPLCSEVKIGEQDNGENVKLDVKLEHNKPVEYIHRESTTSSHVLGALLDVAGAGLLVGSYFMFDERDKAYDKYSAAEKPPKKDWDDVGKKHKMGNTLLIAGGAVFALGIGVHVWF